MIICKIICFASGSLSEDEGKIKTCFRLLVVRMQGWKQYQKR